MPTFETPQPISVSYDLGVTGDVRFIAGDRTDTVVEVQPTNAADDSDVKAATQVSAEYGNGTLHIKGPKARPFDFSRKTRSVNVTVELPSGSQVSGSTQIGDVYSTGQLGSFKVKTSVGHFRLDRTGPLEVSTSSGQVSVDHVAGNAEIRTGSGKVVVGAIEGTAAVKNSNGATEIDEVDGDARVRAANGDIVIDRAGAGVDVKTANGGIRLGEVVSGSVVLGTSMGDLAVGIAEGTAAWLEVNTKFGKVRNELANADHKPDQATATVEVRATTSMGDITIRRA